MMNNLAKLPQYQQHQQQQQQQSVRVLFLPYKDPVRTSPPSAFEPMERDLFEGATIKLGRQVKSNEPSPASANPTNGNNSSNPNDNQNLTPPAATTSPNSNLLISNANANNVNNNRLSTTSEAGNGNNGESLTPTGLSPRETVVGVVNDPMMSMMMATPPPLPKKIVENVWFKSKVVSRCHAEMWLKDGQVSGFLL
jgi:hypothetical protein